MKEYLIVKILEPQSISLPTTFVYYGVELRGATADSSDEIKLFELSAINQHLEYSQYSVCARIATIVLETNALKAAEVANDRFTEVLDLRSIEVSMSNLSVSNIGFIKDLESGEMYEIKNNDFKPCISFYVHQGDIQKFDVTHLMLSADTELSNRYLKSLHWARHAKHENNQQLKVLFYWFSVEALLKESKLDNVGDSLRWFLGFPNGSKSQLVSKALIEELSSDSRYLFWKSKIVKKIDEVREFRNDSTHHGFRTIDIPKEQLVLYNQIMILGVSRCQTAVQTAIINKISTLSEFKDYMPIIFEQNKSLVNDVHKNILFLLEKTNRSI